MSGPEESSLLRRQKRPEGRKRGSHWVRAVPLQGILPLVLVAGVVFAGLWKATGFVLNDARFQLREVQVLGGRYVPESEVEGKFIPDQGKSIARLPLSERRRQIEQIPWVRSAAVARVFPNRLRVHIQERVPVAFAWTSVGLALLDEAGVLLDVPPEAAFTFPVVRGISDLDSPAERRAKMRLFSLLLADLSQGSNPPSALISEVDLSDPKDARVVIADPVGAVLLHFGQEQFFSRYMTYAGHIAEWRMKFGNIQSVDLRFEGQVVVNADPQPDLQGAAALRSSLPTMPSTTPSPVLESGLSADSRLPSP